jgi:TnpA family transposase
MISRDYLEAAATAATSKGRCSGRPATTAPAASIRRLSLKAGIMAPSVMLRKLAAYRRHHQLDLALQELGRIECTLFMLDWLVSPELRRRCRAGLNKSEQRHFLAQVICTFKQGRQTRPANKAGKQGRIADCSAEAQQFRASGLDLVIAAIVFWNSTYIADAITHHRATEQSVPNA